MGGVIVLAALLLVIVVVALVGAVQVHHAWAARREVKALEKEKAEADSSATWHVTVNHTGANTLVVVQRMTWPPEPVRYFGDPVVVARIAQDASEYEVELERARTTARLRANQLNGFREGEEVTGNA